VIFVELVAEKNDFVPVSNADVPVQLVEDIVAITLRKTVFNQAFVNNVNSSRIQICIPLMKRRESLRSVDLSGR